MSEEKRVFCDYTVEQSIFVGNKEVLLGVDKKNTQEHRFMVCYCSYDNPLGVPWPTEAVGTDDYLEAMQVFLDRVQAQVELVRGEQEKYQFDMTPFTIDDCIPDDRKQSIVGKVVVINAEPKRYEYQHSAYQLVLADGGNGATDGGKIVINYEWGEKVERPCRFIDEYHAEIGNNLYHICQFAELMERNGHTYEPKQEEQPPQKAPKKKDHER